MGVTLLCSMFISGRNDICQMATTYKVGWGKHVLYRLDGAGVLCSFLPAVQHAAGLQALILASSSVGFKKLEN